MPHYEKYTTTMIGAHSIPRRYEAIDRLVSSGQLGPGRFHGCAIEGHPKLLIPRTGDRGNSMLSPAVRCIVGRIIDIRRRMPC